MSTDNLRPVLWEGASIETPGALVYVVETDAAKGVMRALEGMAGEEKRFISPGCDRFRALEKAKLVLRGDREALGDTRVLMAIAAHLVAFLELAPATGSMIALPVKQDILL